METEKRLNRNLKLKVLVLTLGCSGCISILFYRSWWGIVWSPILYFILKKKLKETFNVNEYTEYNRSDFESFSFSLNDIFYFTNIGAQQCDIGIRMNNLYGQHRNWSRGVLTYRVKVLRTNLCKI